MRFYKAKIILLSSFLVVGLFNTPAKADNANPPRITSVEQVTTGPYSVGDIVTFKVGYEGGNPGIQDISIRIRCIKNEGSIKGGNADFIDWIRWNDGEKLTNNSGNGLISGYVSPCPQSEHYPFEVKITDKTRLQNFWDYAKLESQPSLKFSINKSDLLPTPVGEVKPIKMKDTVSIKNIPKTPVAGKTYQLPRLTDNGAPLIWRSGGSCSISWDTFWGDLGGNLFLKSTGVCILRYGSGGSDKYEQPTVYTNNKTISPSKNGSTVPFNFLISKAKK